MLIMKMVDCTEEKWHEVFPVTKIALRNTENAFPVLARHMVLQNQAILYKTSTGL